MSLALSAVETVQRRHDVAATAVNLKYRTAYMSLLRALEISLLFQKTHLSVVYVGTFSCCDQRLYFFPNTAALRPVPYRSFAVGNGNQC